MLQLTDVRVAAGFGHACAVAAGALRCWGDDGDGQLGVAGTDASTGQAPVTVAGGPWVAPAVGSVHSCALATDGGVWCWGGNANGQLGSGDRTSRPEPRQVALPARAVDVRTAFEFTCALLADASVWCWGYNWEGQLGLGDVHPGEDHLEPVQLGSDARLDVRRDRPGTRLRHPLAGTAVLLGAQHGIAARSGDQPAAADARARPGRHRRRLGRGRLLAVDDLRAQARRQPLVLGRAAERRARGRRRRAAADPRPGAGVQRLVGGRPSARFTPAASARAARSGARAATPKARSARPISSTRSRT